MLKDAVKGRVNIVENVNDWKEAITLAAKPLVEDGSVENSYIDAMIANVNKFGTYIVIAPKVAMPHSRPEDEDKIEEIIETKTVQEIMDLI